jgi:hypothetical protein
VFLVSELAERFLSLVVLPLVSNVLHLYLHLAMSYECCNVPTRTMNISAFYLPFVVSLTELN